MSAHFHKIEAAPSSLYSSTSLTLKPAISYLLPIEEIRRRTSASEIS